MLSGFVRLWSHLQSQTSACNKILKFWRKSFHEKSSNFKRWHAVRTDPDQNNFSGELPRTPFLQPEPETFTKWQKHPKNIFFIPFKTFFPRETTWNLSLSIPRYFSVEAPDSVRLVAPNLSLESQANLFLPRCWCHSSKLFYNFLLFCLCSVAIKMLRGLAPLPLALHSPKASRKKRENVLISFLSSCWLGTNFDGLSHAGCETVPNTWSR